MPEPSPPVSTLVRLERACVLLDAGRPSEAADEVRRGLLDSPHDHGLLTVLAACHLESGEPKRAREVSEECIRAVPDDAAGHRLLGLALLDLRRRRAALAALESAARLDPEGPLTLHALARSLLALRRRDRAEEVIDRLSRLAPDWTATHDLRAALAASRRQWSRTERDSRTLLALDAQNVDGLFRLAIAQERQGRLPDAIETMHSALRLAPTNAEARKQLLRLIDSRFRSPPMPYLMATPVFTPIAALAAVHLLWLRLTTRRMLAEHTQPVQEAIRQRLRARDAGGCLQLVAAVLAFPTFFWTLLTFVAPEDLATPTSVAIQAGIWTVVGLLIWRIRVVKSRHRGWL